MKIDRIKQKRKQFMDLIVNSETSFLDDQLDAICKAFNTLYSLEPQQVLIPYELAPIMVTEAEIKSPSLSVGYMARFGANKQLLKCHQSEAAIRADERKRIGEWLRDMYYSKVLSYYQITSIFKDTIDKLQKGQAPEGE